MSGDLSAWLDSDRNRGHTPSKNLAHQPDQRAVTRSSSCGRSSLLEKVVHRQDQTQSKLASPLSDDSKEKSSVSSLGTKESNPFAQVLQRAPSKRTTVQEFPKRAGCSHDRTCPPDSPTSEWDPFASLDESSGKENAFSRILSSGSSGTGKSPAHGEKASRVSAKTNRLSSLQGSAPSSAEATRFCLCPICGKKVIIELCSHHLDKECSGQGVERLQPQSTSSSNVSATPTATPPRSPLSIIRATTVPSGVPSHQSVTPPRQATSTKAPVEVGDAGESEVGDDFAIVLGSSTPPRASQGLGSTADSNAAKHRILALEDPVPKELHPKHRSKSTVPVFPLGAAATKIAFGNKQNANFSNKSVQGRELVLGSWAMTACPICGRQVRVNRCSWHLDNECRGVPAVEILSTTAGYPSRKDQVAPKDDRPRAPNAVPRAKPTIDTVSPSSSDAASSGCKLKKRASLDTCARGMTACPVCGQPVRADRCSWHLDNKCPGSPSTAQEVTATPVEQASSGNNDSKRKRSDGRAEALGSLDCATMETGVKESADEAQARVGDRTTGGLTALAAELQCPICLCLFEDPHGLPCSHRFCKSCIMECFKSTKRQECPFCKVPAWKRDLKRDVQLQNIVAVYRRMAS